MYSSKAILLSMYQKFIQDEVNIQLQQPKKLNQKQQQKKKSQYKSDQQQKSQQQQKQQLRQSEQNQQIEQDSPESSEEEAQEDEQKQIELQKQAELDKQKLLQAEQSAKQTKQKKPEVDKQKSSTQKEDSQIQKQQQQPIQQKAPTQKEKINPQTQQEKKQKQKQEKQKFRVEIEEDENDEEWVEVGNKKKLPPQQSQKTQQQQQERNQQQGIKQTQELKQEDTKQQVIKGQPQIQPQKQQQQQQNIPQKPQQPQQPQQPIVNSSQKVQQPKQQQQTQPIVQTQQKPNNQVQDQSKQKQNENDKNQTKQQKKQLKKIVDDQIDEEEGWISVEPKSIKNINKEQDSSKQEAEEVKQTKKKGLFTKEEYQQLKEDAKKIEEAYKLRIQQIEDIHRAKVISKHTQYEVKNADQLFKTQYVAAPPKIEYKMPEVQPKFMTREEIDQLIQAKMPKTRVFVEKSEPLPQQVVKSSETKKIQFKSKINFLKPIQQEKNEQKLFTDPPITFETNKDTSKSFFTTQVVLTVNTTGKDVFGRVKKFRRPIQEKKQPEQKQKEIYQVKANELNQKPKDQDENQQTGEKEPTTSILLNKSEAQDQKHESANTKKPQVRFEEKPIFEPKVQKPKEQDPQDLQTTTQNQNTQDQKQKSNQKQKQPQKNQQPQQRDLYEVKQPQQVQKVVQKKPAKQSSNELYVPKAKETDEIIIKNQNNEIKQDDNLNQNNQIKHIEQEPLKIQEQQEINILKEIDIESELNLQSGNQEIQIELQQGNLEQNILNEVEQIVQTGSNQPQFVEEEEVFVSKDKPVENQQNTQQQSGSIVEQIVQTGSNQPQFVEEEEVFVSKDKPVENQQNTQQQSVNIVEQVIQTGSNQPQFVEEEEVFVSKDKPVENRQNSQQQSENFVEQVVQTGSNQPQFVEEEEVFVSKDKPVENKENTQQQSENIVEQVVQTGSNQPQFVEEEEVFVSKDKPIENIQTNTESKKSVQLQQGVQQQEIDNEVEIIQKGELLQVQNDSTEFIPAQQLSSQQQKQDFNQKILSKLDAPSPIDREQKITSMSNIMQNEFSQDIREDSSFLAEMDQKQRVLPGYLDLTFNSRKKLINKNIPVTYRTEPGYENILELETMSLILDGCKEIIADEYVNYLENVRRIRRSALNQKRFSDYIKYVIQMAEEQFRIIQEGFNCIAQSLNINEEAFQNSFVFYSQHEEFGKEFVEQLTFVQQNMKDIPQIKVSLRKQQGIELMKYQIDVIESYTKHEYFGQILDLFNDMEDVQDAKPILLNTLIDDVIFEKYGYEEEDKINFMKKFHNDKEVKSLQAKQENLVENLFNIQLE
ncbi:unnamed protein product (macronuclear) [Paramecium tetraurelia]|uniref:Uncharacterized protein n=1 Tax=Paramecium tetraurelia TaxID=5888 RepID=A0CNR9_PARTE|nr:uncharacterized protein GSPATT00008878001 [Paramecium tetraurelia]CAK72436.1 unnamed protein product [Paramecium tetraurelia]|eukprot:XP_001439833.1 hypothetical protein (macronuclear) [Paramecium tetraurelia strain d4-2]